MGQHSKEDTKWDKGTNWDKKVQKTQHETTKKRRHKLGQQSKEDTHMRQQRRENTEWDNKEEKTQNGTVKKTHT